MKYTLVLLVLVLLCTFSIVLCDLEEPEANWITELDEANTPTTNDPTTTPPTNDRARGKKPIPANGGTLMDRLRRKLFKVTESVENHNKRLEEAMDFAEHHESDLDEASLDESTVDEAELEESDLDEAEVDESEYEVDAAGSSSSVSNSCPYTSARVITEAGNNQQQVQLVRISADQRAAGAQAADTMIAKSIACAWYRLFIAAKSARHSIGITSGFRSLKKQYAIWQRYQQGGGALVARPGTSNHGTGLAIDIKGTNTAADTWLQQNAAKYGFIRSLVAEPWHYLYSPSATNRNEVDLDEANLDEENEVELDESVANEEDDDEYMPAHIHVEVNVDIDDGQETEAQHQQYVNELERVSEQRKQ